ncbi:ammonium transporter [Pseudogemmobacter faecipullorum]|uniref:Ammonium transporter n=1 Tax=Pseudogemmobacter faecipullorum TaxID=2755041 RepID=A0ABS8CGJ4_9RHOB|nr:ammonium transporter [Pseudogemmobacter faecipullorum]MCB5408516.1 ammonium transporter [Pseudogemmobacter faecipullorum]
MEQATAIFADQVTLSQLLQNLVYASGTVGAIMVVAGLLMIDAGTTRTANLYNSTIEKMVGFFIGFTTYYMIGFGFWAGQYYIMGGATMMDSLKDWWFFGTLANAHAQNVDPAVWPGLNTFQIFIFFLACFAGIVNVLLHFSVSERMKASAFYITCVAATIGSAVLSWAVWGSVGPLTNAGFHDFFGIGFVYIFPTGIAMVLVPQLGQRPGVFSPHPKVPVYQAPSIGLAATGVITVFAGLPMVIMSCLFFVEPEAYAISVTMADTSVGIALNNYALAWAGGALTGAAISYYTKNYIYLLFGPLAGYVAGAPGFDIWLPWQMFLIALGAPFGSWLVYSWTFRRGIDEHKLFPLFIGAGFYGLMMIGLFKSGTPRGGYWGITEGPYAYQHGQISLMMQLAGFALCLGAGLLMGFVLSLILKATTGLRIPTEDQAEGLDKLKWGLDNESRG